MPGRTRSRTRHLYSSGGVKKLSDGTWRQAPASGTADDETCSDTTMSPPFDEDHPLSIRRRWTEPLYINGTATEYIHGNVAFINFAPSNRANSGFCPTPTPVDFGYWKTKALGNMDPYKPHVDIPLFIFELKDFPGMLRDIGKVLKGNLRPSDVPGGYLAYQFGWKPLVDDALKMFDLSTQIDKRIKYIRNLQRGRRIKRTLKREDRIAHSLIPNGYQTYANVPTVGKWAYTADVEREETLKVWFTANAELLVDFPTSLPELRTLSTKAVLGLSLRPDLLWNALPWSWLVDYMANVGDYIEAQQGLTRFKCTRMCVMAQSVLTDSLVNPRLAPGLSASVPVLHTVQKLRAAYVNPTPSISAVPFLTGTQTSILGALATASALRGFKR